jgi:hypothetical protein
MQSFTAEIFIIGVNPYVLLPEEVLDNLFVEAGRHKGPIPVKGLINGNEFRQTLVRFSGKWRLYINGVMRKAAGIDVGDMADILIEFDSMPRKILMHDSLKLALEADKEAFIAFSRLSPSRQNEIIRYISYLKTEESVNRNIERAIQHLLGAERFVGRDKLNLK